MDPRDVPGLAFGERLAPSARNRFDDAKHHQTYPKVYRHAKVEPGRHMLRPYRQVRQEQEVGNISCQDCRQSLHKIRHS